MRHLVGAALMTDLAYLNFLALRNWAGHRPHPTKSLEEYVSSPTSSSRADLRAVPAFTCPAQATLTIRVATAAPDKSEWHDALIELNDT